MAVPVDKVLPGQRTTADKTAKITVLLSTEHNFFFFQAEDGIRDYKVTGVQTCALPISGAVGGGHPRGSNTLHDRRLAKKKPFKFPVLTNGCSVGAERDLRLIILQVKDEEDRKSVV